MSSVPLTLNPTALIRPEIVALQAYHVPASANLIKLDAMENPYALPAALRASIATRVSDAAINRYPDASGQSLKNKIAQLIDLKEDFRILLGNGSDEIIQLLALAVAKPNAVLLSVEPSFVMFKMIAQFVGMNYVGVPLAQDFALDLPAMLTAIERHQPALIFLAYPNNPTGNQFDAQAVTQIIQAAPGLVVVDEAYYAFAEHSFLPALAQFDNLVVMRTFSKLGMAGLRLGFLVGSAAWIEQLEKLRLPYNVGVLPQMVAEILLAHHDILLAQAAQIKQDRQWLYERLVGTVDVYAYPSQANFILFRVPHASEVFACLKQRGILIKNLDGGHPALRDCLRVTVGTPEENEQFINALQASLHVTF